MLTPGSLLKPGPIATVTSKSALFTVAAADRGTLFDNTGSYTISLTAAATLGAGFSFYTRCVSGTQTIDPNGVETINGSATYAVSNAGDIVLCIVNAAATAWLVQHVQLPSAVAITGGVISGLTTLGVTGLTTAGGGVRYTGGVSAAGTIFKDAVSGLSIQAVAGSAYDFWVGDPSGNTAISMATGTKDLRVVGSLTINSATASTSTSTGSITTAGGIGAIGAIFAGDSSVITASSATTVFDAIYTGAQATNGGAIITAGADSGATMGSGNRFGAIQFKGIRTGTTFNRSNSIDSIATEAWSSTAAGSKMVFNTTQNTTLTRSVALTLDQDLSVIVGNAAIATNATGGFLYIPSCAGTPSGTPVTNTGRIPIVYDSTNNFLYIYNSGWKKSTVYA